ncbi:hypothetical protein CC77DRAFT_767214 [Alternaria alternata]|uniref:Uncharacterized protein n=1 Tax=Alternaria alternata TaxID=5599 RepID=A0A177DRX1_ALTAL|nr:hypothetical protein CC77DRAFT_767214 [Alternaria alternata]OAG21960.1 hypothetical protein CC77DRAFT_767214 [Alternaria alternata]
MTSHLGRRAQCCERYLSWPQSATGLANKSSNLLHGRYLDVQTFNVYCALDPCLSACMLLTTAAFVTTNRSLGLMV